MSLNWSKFEFRTNCVFTFCLMINLQISLALVGVCYILQFFFSRCITNLLLCVAVFLILWYIYNHQSLLMILFLCVWVYVCMYVCVQSYACRICTIQRLVLKPSYVISAHLEYCWICIIQFSWTFSLLKERFRICSECTITPIQATSLMMTRSDTLLVWRWELVMFMSSIT